MKLDDLLADDNVEPEQSAEHQRRFAEGFEALAEEAKTNLKTRALFQAAARDEQWAIDEIGRRASGVDDLERQVAERDAHLKRMEREAHVRTIHETVRQLAPDAGLVPTATEDAVLLAESELEIGASGKIVSKRGQNVFQWLQSKRASRRHWFGHTAETEKRSLFH